MNEEEEKQFKKLSREYSMACQHVDGEYLNYGLRQYWYGVLRELNEKMDALIAKDLAVKP